MPRRFFIPELSVGLLQLDASQSHHLRDVLRLATGATVDVFDRTGNSATAVIQSLSEDLVSLHVDHFVQQIARSEIVLASAVPKGERADWMIEKLSELGVSRFVPLITARSIVTPGSGKITRWQRIATESSKQSQRVGVMKIDSPVTLDDFLKTTSSAFYGSTEMAGTSLSSLVDQTENKVTSLLIGPEGGWTDEERATFERHKILPFQLTETILRVETAAIVAAAVACLHR